MNESTTELEHFKDILIKRSTGGNLNKSDFDNYSLIRKKLITNPCITNQLPDYINKC